MLKDLSRPEAPGDAEGFFLEQRVAGQAAQAEQVGEGNRVARGHGIVHEFPGPGDDHLQVGRREEEPPLPVLEELHALVHERKGPFKPGFRQGCPDRASMRPQARNM